ncbi:MAG TPA: 3D domain-containing protein [Clostridia bacterium]|nr:3D domain-containing protein [Clostridia bacterium]
MTRLQKTSLAIMAITAAVMLSVHYHSVIATETGQEQPLALVCVTCAAEATEGNAEPLIEYTATAYCPCEKCCGKWANRRPNGKVIGAGGVELIEGYHIASSLPIGTTIKITDAGQWNGEYIVQDKPADWICEKYNDKIVDFYFERHADALAFGKMQVKVEVVEW